MVVRNSYNRWHTLPGGRVDRGETFRAGAARELREETGIALPETDFTCVHAETHRWQQRTERIEIHATDLETRPAVHLDAVEIAEARWLTVDAALALRLYPPLRHYLEAARNGSVMETR
ncbi:MAG: NUDIX hydrolase [Minwuia sp.]|nr:NUDIX hydrolase [Minwuia sp.]